MVIKGIKRKLREKFEHDMSGLELKAGGDDLKDVYVTFVMDNSPGEQAGLLPGDQLIFMNNRAVRNMTMNEIYKLLQKGPGKTVDLLVKRGEDLFITQVTLKRMI